MKDFQKKSYYYYFISFISAFAFFYFIFFICKIAPFGSNSLASADANIQYLDFFSYYQDCLRGSNSILYSFSKGLGGTNLAEFTYYLSSPFNLLVLLFSKENLNIFFNLLVALKLATACLFTYYFLRNRFADRLSSGYYQLLLILLSLSYSASQYCTAQGNNIMWLDGVYMLPLILCGMYRLRKYNQKTLLIFAVGLNVIFNWYTAGINCVFSAFWILLEILLLNFEDNEHFSWRNSLQLAYRYIISMTGGLLLGACALLPTVIAMKKSSRGSLDFSGLLDFSSFGNPLSVVSSYFYGEQSSLGYCCIFCGALAIFACINFFLLKSVNRRLKLSVLIIFTLVLSSFFFTPFSTCFSLFKPVGSYWYRYSYVAILFIIFIAAYFFSKAEEGITNTCLVSVIIFIIILAASNLINSRENLKRLLLFAFILIAISILVHLIYKGSYSNKTRNYLICLLCVFVIADLGFSTVLQYRANHTEDTNEYKRYSKLHSELISDLKSYDSSAYRINKAFSRRMNEYNLTANYNESYGYNYYSINSYTSSPSEIQRDFLDRLGYSKSDVTSNATIPNLLAADSLLGCRYIISKESRPELEPVADINSELAKVYYNQYSLPLAFSYEPATAATLDESNCFEYINSLYEHFCSVSPFIRLDYSCSSGNKLSYDIIVPSGNYILYACIPPLNYFEGKLYCNKKFICGCARYWAPNTIEIPDTYYEGSANISVSSDNDISINQDEVCFYALDLDALYQACTRIKENNTAEITSFENGSIEIKAKAKASQSLYISIPYDDDWKLELNGKEIKPSTIADCMYNIKLEDGSNIITMKYRTDYLYIGFIVSLLTLIIVVLVRRIRK